ncbi:2117_t:CDS:2, partial [Dentiscutata erythropus]
EFQFFFFVASLFGIALPVLGGYYLIVVDFDSLKTHSTTTHSFFLVDFNFLKTHSTTTHSFFL